MVSLHSFLIYGLHNIAIGNFALSSNTTGYHNVAVGVLALYYNTASDNTATGYSALKSNTSGNKNVAYGSYALDCNTTGYGNVAIGHSANVAFDYLLNATVFGSSANVS